MSSKPKISAPFNPVHLTTGRSSEQLQRHQRHPSSSSLSPDNSPHLRPTTPSSSSARGSPRPIRNFSRPTTPQPPSTSERPVTPQSPKSLTLSPESTARPRRKSWFKEENLDNLSPTTGSATASHNLFPTEARRSSSTSSHLRPPPSPSAYPQRHTPAKNYNRDTAGKLQTPPTPASPSFLISRDSEDGSQPNAVELPAHESRSSHEQRRGPPNPRSFDSSAPASQHSGGLVSGERKRSMWERVLRRPDGEGMGEERFPARRSSDGRTSREGQ